VQKSLAEDRSHHNRLYSFLSKQHRPDMVPSNEKDTRAAIFATVFTRKERMSADSGNECLEPGKSHHKA